MSQKKAAIFSIIHYSVESGPELRYLVLIICLVALRPLLVQAQAPRSPTPPPANGAFNVGTVAKGLEHPWSLAFLPDGRMLVTERPGRLRLAGRDGKLSEPLDGVPRVYASGQGGLLDVALSPAFNKDRLVYLSFAEPGEGGAGTAVARGRLGEAGLENVQVIWRQQPKVSSPNHWGSRIVFRPDGTLFVTLGDRFNYSDSAQDLSTTIGKIVRINPDGSPPKDNPFVGRAGATARDLVDRASQRPGGRAPARLWTAVDRGARRPRR